MAQLESLSASHRVREGQPSWAEQPLFAAVSIQLNITPNRDSGNFPLEYDNQTSCSDREAAWEVLHIDRMVFIGSRATVTLYQRFTLRGTKDLTSLRVDYGAPCRGVRAIELPCVDAFFKFREDVNGIRYAHLASNNYMDRHSSHSCILYYR